MGMSVTSAEFQRAFGRYREAALQGPITITNHGRESLVLLSAEEYRRLKRRDRDALLVTELSASDLDAIAKAEIPAEAVEFDDELKS
jgi:prevent-host-death family protein